MPDNNNAVAQIPQVDPRLQTWYAEGKAKGFIDKNPKIKDWVAAGVKKGYLHDLSQPTQPQPTAVSAPPVAPAPVPVNPTASLDTPGQAELRRIYPQIVKANPAADLNRMLPSVRGMTPEQVRARAGVHVAPTQSDITQAPNLAPIEQAGRFLSDAGHGAVAVPAAIIEARLLKRPQVAAGIIQKSVPTAGGAFGRSAGRATLPTAGGFAGATAAAPVGAAAGGVLGSPFGPGGVAFGEAAGGIVAGLAGAVGAGHVVNQGQDKLISWLIGHKAKKLLDEASARDNKEQPGATFAGELAPSLLFGAPNLERGAAATAQRVAGAGVGGAMEGYNQLQQKHFDPARLAAATAAGAVLSGHETPIGEVVTAPGRVVGEAAAGAIRRNVTAPALANRVVGEVDPAIHAAEQGKQQRLDEAIHRGMDPALARQLFDAVTTPNGETVSYVGTDPQTGEHTFKMSVKKQTGEASPATGEPGINYTNNPLDPIHSKVDSINKSAATQKPEVAATETSANETAPIDWSKSYEKFPSQGASPDQFGRVGIKNASDLYAAIRAVKPELGDEQAKHTTLLVESLARGMSKELGTDPDKWYDQNLAGLVKEGEVTAKEFADEFNRTKRPSDSSAKPDEFKGFAEKAENYNLDEDDARTVIGVLASANESTLPHELGHLFLNSLEKAASKGNEVANKDLQTVLDWAGVDNVHDAQETFSSAYEKHLKDGEPFNSSLASTFGKFKQWLSKIYHVTKQTIFGKKLEDSLIARSISPKMMDILQRYHGSIEGVNLDQGRTGETDTGRLATDLGGGRQVNSGANGVSSAEPTPKPAGNPPGASSGVPTGTGTNGGGHIVGGDTGKTSTSATSPRNPSPSLGDNAATGNQRTAPEEVIPPGHKTVSVVVDGEPRTTVLPPDKAALWDAEIERYAKQRLQLQTSGGGDKQHQQGLLRAAAFQHAAKKREITGLLTSREQFLANEKAQAKDASVARVRKALGKPPLVKQDTSVLPMDQPDTAPNPYEIEHVGNEVSQPAETNTTAPKTAPVATENRDTGADGATMPPARQEAKKRPAIVAKGRESTAYTPTGNRAVKTRFAVVDADSLVLSQNDTGANLGDNPEYDRALQPRDRTRLASVAQVDGIARKITPARLGDSASTAEGSPIVGADLQVESGNGRGLAIRRAYKQYGEKGQEYKKWLRDNAEQFGLSAADVEAHEKPVLIRVRDGELSPTDRASLASEMGASPVASRSETEIATEDGKRLRDGNLLSRVATGEHGDMNTKENRPFIREFLATVPESDRAALVQDDGALSAQGLRRVRNAVLAAAYDDPSTVARLAESTDDNVLSVGRAMFATAPRMAQLKQAIASGDRFALDISKDIAEAANTLSDIRRKGQSVDEFLSQGSMFGDELSKTGKQLLEAFDKYKRSPTKLTEILKGYADSVDAAGSPKQENLFGDKTVISADVVLSGVLQRMKDPSTGVLFQRRQHGLIARYLSEKNGESNLLQSSYEAVRVAELEKDSDVVRWRRNKTGIAYFDPETEKERRYFPDFIVERKDGSVQVEEVKPEKFVSDAVVQAKALAARAFYKEQNIEYKFVTEKDLARKRIEAARKAMRAGSIQDEEGNPLFQRRVNGSPAPMKPTAKRANPLLVGISEAANIQKTLMSSWDLSAPLRQGAVYTLTDWMSTQRATKDMLAALASKKNFETFVETIEQHPRRTLAEESGLHLTTLAGDAGREENFSSKLAEKVPGVAASERAYVAYLDRQRLDVFSKYADNLDSMKLTPDQKSAALKDVAGFVNIATGRGKIPAAIEGSAAKLFNGLLFSPRYMSSKVHFLAVEPARLLLPENKGGYAPGARKLVAAQYAKYISMMILTAGLVRAAGGKINTDPDNSDFLKARFGDTRYDLTAGNAQYVRLGFRLAKGYANVAAGKENDRGKDPLSILGQFAKGKLSPMGSFAVDASTGKDFSGKPFKLAPTIKNGELEPGAIGERLIPLPFQDFHSAFKAEGLAGVAKTTPGLLGVGVNTHK